MKLMPSLWEGLCVGLVVCSVGYSGTPDQQPWTYPCTMEPAKSADFCDETMSFSDRAWALVNNLTIDEMAGLSWNKAQAIDRWNIPFYEWWNEAQHGIAMAPGIRWINPTYATGFPQIIGVGSSLNRTLWNMIGESISTEGRAFFNNKQGGLTFWAPNINVFRDPRWGRGQETPGEDPFINAEYAVEFVRGFEGHDLDTPYLKASACCKHFAVYDMEDSDGYTRHDFDAEVSDYDLNDTYFPAFKACIMKGEASSVMCSVNAVNGIPTCESSFLLTDMVRDTWKLDGYITSDCDSLKDAYDEHHYGGSWDDTVALAFDAGMDMNCGSESDKYVADAISNGLMSEDTLRTAIYHLILVQMRLGMFDKPESTPWSDLSTADVASKKHLQISREASEQSIVLLKNDGFLPLNYDDQIKKQNIVLIGTPLGSARTQNGNYWGQTPFMISLRDALDLKYYNNEQVIFFAQGSPLDGEEASNNQTERDAAVAMIEGKKMVILGVGLENAIEKEGTDRTSLMLPSLQIEMAEAVLTEADKLGIPVVLIVSSGGCVDISAYMTDSRISAIIWSGYGSMFGGSAVLDVMIGNVNPVGVFTQTWYTEKFAQQVEMIDMRMLPNSTDNYPGRGYRYYNGDQVVLPFGFGMSYVDFMCDHLMFNDTTNIMSFTITSMGSKSGLYNSFNGTSVSAAVLVYWQPTQPNTLQKRLVAFDQVIGLVKGEEVEHSTPVYEEFMIHQEYKGSGQFVFGGACEGS